MLQDDINYQCYNFTKTSPSNSGIITRLCNEVGRGHEKPRHQREVHSLDNLWQILKRVVFSKKKKKSVRFDKCSKSTDLFGDDKWLQVVCYLAGISKN